MNNRNVNRITSSSLGLAFAVLTVFLLRQFFPEVDFPDNVVLAIGTVVTFAVQVVISKTGINLPPSEET